jgi:hypothetical protein
MIILDYYKQYSLAKFEYFIEFSIKIHSIILFNIENETIRVDDNLLLL